MVEFKIKVDGETRDFESRFGEYALAVMEAFGKLNLPYPCDVEIWVPKLLPDYGPHLYRIDNFTDVAGREYVAPSIMSRH